MAYYLEDDLIIRRVSIARWICSQINQIVADINYGELLPQEEITKFQYVVACLEALECYTPILSDDEDGESNCLTEAQVDSIMENVSKITGLHFHAKGTSYNPNNYEGAIPRELDTFELNDPPTALALERQPWLGNGAIQLNRTVK